MKTAIVCICGLNNWETVEDKWVHAARGLAFVKKIGILSYLLAFDVPVRGGVLVGISTPRLVWENKNGVATDGEKISTNRKSIHANIA